MPGLYGFSVQFAPGKTVDELAQAGRFPHPLISNATTDALAAALRLLGYSMRLVKSPGQGYYHTFAVLCDANGTMLQALPRDAALALGQTFRRRPYPYQVP
jgi:hypothetical protein